MYFRQAAGKRKTISICVFFKFAISQEKKRRTYVSRWKVIFFNFKEQKILDVFPSVKTNWTDNDKVPFCYFSPGAGDLSAISRRDVTGEKYKLSDLLSRATSHSFKVVLERSLH